MAEYLFARLTDVDASAAIAAAQAAAASAAAALASENNAETAQGLAETARDDALTAQAAAEAAALAAEVAVDSFDDVYLGSKSVDPTVDNDGDPLIEGQLYWNNSSNQLRVYDGAAWAGYSAQAGITALIDDPNPTLANDLQLETFSLFSDATSAKGIYLKSTFVPIFQWISHATPANYLEFRADAAGTGPGIIARGSDTDIDIRLSPKGGGAVAVLTNGLTVPDDPYDATGWNANTYVPTKNAVRDVFEGIFSTLTTGYQPLDADLTAIAALTTTSFGRSVLETANAAALATLAGVGTSDNPQLASIQLGHASDTTLTRSAAGKLDVEGHTVLTDDEEDQGPLTGGAGITAKALGTVTTGTTTIDVRDRPVQEMTNGGASTLDVATNTGYTILIITNNGSAGALNTSAFDLVRGNAFTTTNGHVFRCLIEYWGPGRKWLTIERII